jgi:putative hydrolase of the HAD superfamily
MIDLVALDADDTLWHNEPLYRTTRDQLRGLLEGYVGCEGLDEALDDVERRNLRHFGYGVKGFVLSMIETSLDLTGGRLDGADVRRIIEWGRDMLQSPVELLPGVPAAVAEIAREVPLVLVTKGDLFHQEAKLARSGLAGYFAGAEIVSEKDVATYRAVMARYRVEAARFLMVGNSLRSDVLPVLEAGGQAVYIPYPLVWSHEFVPQSALADLRYHEIDSIDALPPLVTRLRSGEEAVASPSRSGIR